VTIDDAAPDPPATTRDRTDLLTGSATSAGPPDQGPVQAWLSAFAARVAAGAASDAPGTDRSGWQAATALVLAPGPDDVEVAIIERSRRTGDRWSGHLALPGGRREDGDATLADTAARETHEEVGLHLGPPLGCVAAHRARIRPGVVACYAFVLDRPRAMTPQPREVANAWWVPLGALTDPANATTIRHTGIRFPAIDVHGRALWGLTLKTLEQFAALADVELATG
jgi:8-oxo-dGTP pyrophosphatase MutT (NUDIX family)